MPDLKSVVGVCIDRFVLCVLKKPLTLTIGTHIDGRVALIVQDSPLLKSQVINPILVVLVELDRLAIDSKRGCKR